MTDRVRTLTVVLSEDWRSDDAEGLAEAIAHMNGVSYVKLGPPVDPIERISARREIVGQLRKALDDVELGR